MTKKTVECSAIFTDPKFPWKNWHERPTSSRMSPHIIYFLRVIRRRKKRNEKWPHFFL